jgi:hypothetical protein
MAVAKKKAVKPTKRTKAIAIVRVDGVKPKVATLKAVNAKVVAQDSNQSDRQTPYRLGSVYQAIIEALRRLGTNQWHSFDKIIPAIAEKMGSRAKSFKAKEKRNRQTGKSWKDRIIQNCAVLARKDYGKPCRDVLVMEVRFDGHEKKAGLFGLAK